MYISGSSLINHIDLLFYFFRFIQNNVFFPKPDHPIQLYVEFKRISAGYGVRNLTITLFLAHRRTQ